ncbi:MAG TPA: hypothetical protein VHM91_16840 [Verrucomicrobiales bacterium]|jgi:hypothetical protein|nr:hypothetical protein [Verrucomicrobiales bacterium]
MKQATTILAALALGAGSVLAGTAPAPSGKGPAPTPIDPCAGPISYNNIELLYAYTDFDDSGLDNGNGGKLNIEYSPANNFYITVGAEYLDADYGNAWLLNGGIGGYIPLTSNIHLAADAGILWSQVELDNVVGDDSDSDTGWYVRPHLRGKWGCLTAHLGAEYTDVFNDERWSGFLNLYYQLNPSWDLTAGVRVNEDATTITAGVRYRY